MDVGQLPDDTGAPDDADLQRTEADERADQELLAGFEGAAAPTETPGPAEEVVAQVQAAAPEFVQVTKDQLDTLLKSVEEVERLKSTAEKSFGTAFGKIGGLERVLAPKVGHEFDQADIDAMRADGFETHAKALEKIRDLQVLRTGGTLTDEDKAELRQSVKRELQTETVEDEHPDWRDQVATTEFKAWKATRSAAEQARLDSEWNPGFIIRSLSTFKKSLATARATPAQDTTRQSLLEAAVVPRGQGGPAANAEDDPESQLLAGWKHERQA